MSETSVVSPKVDAAIYEAIAEAKREAKFVPNESQEEAIAWALRRRLSLIRGPPGTATGKDESRNQMGLVIRKCKLS